MARIAWDQYFMAQAHLLKSRSTCERLSVGAVIVREKRMIAGGYNGSVTGGVHCTDEGCYVVDGHCIRTIHAEMNALLQCSKFGVATEGAEIYVSHFPCVHCTKAIIQAGIRAVYYGGDYKNHPYAVELLQHAGVHTEEVPSTVAIRDSEEETRLMDEMLERLKEKDDPEYEEFRRKVDNLTNERISSNL
ncbi:ComE operon protein 2 [Salimicrobium album]|uniref:ComE operon protein 2 n=1 Tax=Salimicrobium album TaxID=50717 RepID=A0A1H3DP77_9BACI|nr:ComE operon protein 2 [Salimicrobium album]SDX67459.1 dCMP deaminase [Salimicrobium album]